MSSLILKQSSVGDTRLWGILMQRKYYQRKAWQNDC